MTTCRRCGHDIKLTVRIVQSRTYHPGCYEFMRKHRNPVLEDIWHELMKTLCKHE